MLIGSLKQQNLTAHGSLKNKEDIIYKLENHIEDYKHKLNQMNDEYLRIDENFKINTKELSNVQIAKEDLEHKVNFRKYFINL